MNETGAPRTHARANTVAIRDGNQRATAHHARGNGGGLVDIPIQVHPSHAHSDQDDAEQVVALVRKAWGTEVAPNGAKGRGQGAPETEPEENSLGNTKATSGASNGTTADYTRARRLAWLELALQSLLGGTWERHEPTPRPGVPAGENGKVEGVALASSPPRWLAMRKMRCKRKA